MVLRTREKMDRYEAISENAERDPVILGESLRERMLPFGWFERRGADAVTFITDHAGSVPLYYAQEQGRVLAGSTPLEVARQVSAVTFDPVSVADFLLNGTVCYPFTLFKNVYAAPPGAVTEVTPYEVNSVTYYRPIEQVSNESVAYWGLNLRKQVQKALLTGLEGKKNIKVLFSGGEDSRAVVSLLPADLNCELITFADGYNREVRLAERAARALGRPLRFVKRPEGFYQQKLSERVKLIGGVSDVRNTHVFGVLAEAVRDADAIVGGFTSDTLFKSLWKGNIETGLRRFGPEKLRQESAREPTGVQWLSPISWMRLEVTEAADARRWALHEQIEEFRPTTAGNWHLMWPLGSHQPDYGHYLATKSVGPDVVEPFFSPQVYSLAARMPDAFRVDRRAFRAAFAPAMGKAGWLPTSSGRIPRLGGYVGHWVELGTVVSRRLSDRATRVAARIRGRAPMNQGAWSSTHPTSGPDLVAELSASRLEHVRALLDQILTAEEASVFFKGGGTAAPDLVRNRLRQVAYLMDD